MGLYEEWTGVAYDSNRPKGEIERFWKDYFDKEKSVYEKLLENPDEKVSGTVSELAEKYGLSVFEMTGFLDGINDSLVEKNPLETMDENTVVSLDFDNELLYKNMVEAEAEWLYNIESWKNIFDDAKRKELFLEQKNSKTVRVGRKIGRNEPCPCGSGKKYKFCHGKKGAEPLPEELLKA